MRDFFSQITGQSYDVKQAVIVHLNNLTNSRQGSSACMPDYGLPEFSPHQVFAYEKKSYITAMKALLKQFEPRIIALEIIEVSPQHDICILQLQLQLLLAGNDAFNLNALLFSDGKVVISG